MIILLELRNPVNILISSAGRRVELLECFRRAAVELRLDLKVYAVDANPQMSSACQQADNAWEVPRCTHPDYIPTLFALCKREKIRLVIPTIDTELEILASVTDQFKSIGTRILVSNLETIRMARNKAATCCFLDQIGIPTPKTGTVDELLGEPTEWNWPVILKPTNGSCSVGLHFAENPREVENFAIDRTKYIAQEVWQGKEYTINVFFDSKGVLRCAVPHWRCETRGGEVSKGITQRNPVLMTIAVKLADALRGKAFGPICFQAIVDNSGKAAVFEINARFGGGYPLADRAGGTFAKWLIEEAFGLPSSAHNNWNDGVTMLRYDAAVFFNAPF